MLAGTADVANGASREDDADNDDALLPAGARNGVRPDEDDGDSDDEDEIVNRGGRMDGGGMSLESKALAIDGSEINTGA